jgi:hypothetical protein
VDVEDYNYIQTRNITCSIAKIQSLNQLNTSFNMSISLLSFFLFCILSCIFAEDGSQAAINFTPLHRYIFTDATQLQISEQLVKPSAQKMKRNLRTEPATLASDIFTRFTWYSDASCTTAVEETSFHTGQCAPWAGPYVIVNVIDQTSTSWTTQFNYFENADCSTASSFAPATVSFTKDACVTIPGTSNYLKLDVDEATKPASPISTAGAITQAIYSSQQDCVKASQSTPALNKSVMTVNYPFGSCFPGWKGFDFKPISCESGSQTVLAYDSHDGSCAGLSLAVMVPTDAFSSCVPSSTMPGFWVQYQCSPPAAKTAAL